MKKSLAITGSYKGWTGHDHHTRSIVRGLHERGIEIELHDLPMWSPAKLPPHLLDRWFDTLQEPRAAESHLYFCMPHQIGPSNGQRIFNYTMFEADRIPASWVTQAQAHTLVIVPTRYCRQAWIDSGVPEEKVIVCPLGVDCELFKPDGEAIKLELPLGRSTSDFRFRFLNIADATERKNLIGLLRAWLMTTKSADDAILIMKTSFQSQSVQAQFFDRVKQVETELGKSFAQAAPIRWVGGIFPLSSMPGLYATATHYISASRGEGFDLPMVEAAACGLQLIAPKHSAYLDYLNDEIAHLIPATMTEAIFPANSGAAGLFSGSHWWQPDMDELCLVIREIIDGTAETKKPARSFIEQLTWSRTAQQLDELIYSSK